MELELQELFHWMFYTRNGMLILCLVCFIAFAVVAVILETRTRKRFYNHAKKNRGEKAAKKAGATARKVADNLKERNIAEDGFLGASFDFDYDEDEDAWDDDDDEGDDAFDGLFSSLRQDLGDWDEDEEDEEDEDE